MKKVKKLEKEIEGLREEITTLHTESRLEIEDHLQATYFKGLPLTRVSNSDFEDFTFELRKEGYNHPQEICRVRLSKSDYRKNLDQIGLSYYSTTEVSDWEINRLVIIGKVAQVVKDNKESILNSVKTIPSKNLKKISNLRSQIWGLENEIDSIKKEKYRLDRKNSLNLLFSEGIEFDDDERSKGCAVRNDHYVRNVKKIKFLNWTNDNKKSLSVEITTSYPSVFKDKDNGIDDRTEVYNKVRLFNLDHFINCKTQQLEKELV